MAALAPLYAIARKIAWKKVYAGLGGRVKVSVIGGGTTPMFLEDFFEIIGIPLTVGYGLTETSPVLSNRFAHHNVPGSVGLPLPGTDIRVVDPDTMEPLDRGKTGLVLARGPGVFAGYAGNAEASVKAFHNDYFNTGDLGQIIDQGDLVITGRQKDLIVLSSGENVSPQAIEDALLESSLIQQVLVVGQDERHLGALIVPNMEELRALGLVDAETATEIDEANGDRAKLQKIEQALRRNAELDRLVKHELRTRVESLIDFVPSFRVPSYRLILTPFTIENGMMTQTLKVKKNIVRERFPSEIAEIFRH